MDWKGEAPVSPFCLFDPDRKSLLGPHLTSTSTHGAPFDKVLTWALSPARSR